MSAKTPDQIIAVGEQLLARLTACDLCPHECGVDRTAGETGQCGVGDTALVASCNLHHGEEPPISGTRGSGTIFFSGCSLCCLYCQNYPISQQLVGSPMTIEELADNMLALQKRGAHNINLVTPDHFMGHIVTAIGRARQAGLTIPILSNCSGWQKTDILRLLEGIIDIYLVDMRYADDEIARNCSEAIRYKEVNRAAVKEMYRQIGNLVMDEHGIATRGMLVRHLVLPEGNSGSEEVFHFLAREVSPKVYVSLMSQYFPAYKAVGRDVFGRRITPAEFDKAVEMFYTAGLENGFIQEMEPTGA
ncbi:MAG: radical SAM protein [candidate division Zixibacteria bacterium]|nr:radical SAM protein [candidate division Zixibacteria bacterium]